MFPTDTRFDQSYRPLARSLMARAIGFAQCPPALLDDLVSHGTLSRLDPGVTMLRRGEYSEDFVMVVEGAIEARIVLPDNRRHLLAFVLPGMFIGYLSIIDGGPLQHDAVAHLPSIVLRMPVAEVQRLRGTSPALHVAIEVQLADRSRRLYDKVAESLLYPLRKRLAIELSQLARSAGIERDGRWTIALRLSQSDLADLLGASRQSVNAELRALQAAGLVQLARGRIETVDPETLRNAFAD